MIGVKVVEVALALGEVKAARAADIPSYLQEVRNLLAIYIVALEHGVLSRPDRRWCMCERLLGCKGRATEFDGGATAVKCPAYLMRHG